MTTMPLRYVCPPWYGCRCHGKPVSRTTMLTHRRIANLRRTQLGRGRFRWGPRVDDDNITEVQFECYDTLEEHPSDDESNNLSNSDPNGASLVGSPVRIRNAPRQNELAAELTLQHSLPSDSAIVQDVQYSDVAAPETLENGSPANSVADSAADIDWMPFPSEGNDGYLTEYEDLHVHDNVDFFEYLDLQQPPVSHATANFGLLDWLEEQKVWVRLFSKHGLEFKVMDDILKILKAAQ